MPKTKKIVKLVEDFLNKNLHDQFFLDEIIYDILNLEISDQQFEEVEDELNKRMTKRFK